MLRFYPSLLLGIPFVVVMLMATLSYDYQLSWGLVLSFVFPFIIMVLADSRSKKIFPFKFLELGEGQIFYLQLLSFFIVGMGCLDIAYNGIVFLDPLKYSKLDQVTSIIRHFSSLCWVLAPVGLLLPMKRYLRTVFILWAFIFPVLVMDRNRLLLTSFSFGVTLLYLGILFKNIRVKLIISVVSIFICILIGFSMLGQKRVGESYIFALYGDFSGAVAHKGICQPPKVIPVKPSMQGLPAHLQWIFLYTTTPLYNLSIQYDCEIEDSSILKAQLIPMWKRFNDVGRPYLVNLALNVGTEYLPFYLSFGFWGVTVAFLLQYLILRWSLIRFFKTSSVFDYLILMRFSYCSLMAGFAPQFFIWTNLGFFLVVFGLDKFSASQLGVRLQKRLVVKEFRRLPLQSRGAI